MRAPDGTHYALHGPQGAPLVVLIHGLGLNLALWDRTIPALTPQYRVLAYDISGHGLTPHPLQGPSLQALAAQTAGLLDHLGVGQAAIIGFSLGGMIARRFAQGYPQRTLCLGVLHSPHRRSPAAQTAILNRVRQAQADGPIATADAALVRWFSDAFRAGNPAMMDQVRAWILANDPATYPHYYRLFADAVAEVVAPIPAIRCPALVIAADQDHGNSPAMAHAIAAEIAGAETVILPNLRHMALMEDPAATNAALLGFLDRALDPLKSGLGDAAPLTPAAKSP